MDTSFGIQQKGKRNLITDVAGITVGHCTLADGDVQTGVTALLPHQGDLFHDRCPAAVHVINGFGKSAGLVQVQELGYLETPLILTNTLSVGTAFTACVRYMLARNDQIGRAESTVNPVILECNDGYLNDIRGLHVTEDHVFAALDAADTTFALGAVGAGRGMSCYHLKGGIGSASRVFEIGGQTYTLGALAMTNFGSLIDLTIAGERIGKKLAAEPEDAKGSCIMVLPAAVPGGPAGPERPCAHRRSHRARQRRDRARLLHGQPHPGGADLSQRRLSQRRSVPAHLPRRDRDGGGEYHPLHAGGRDRHRPRRPHPPVAARCDGKSRSAPVKAE